MPKKPVFTKPTARRIAAEIRWLEKNRFKVRPTPAWDDNHQAAIDAQIMVLEGDGSSPMSENEIHHRWGDPDNEDSPQNVLNAALQTRRWLDGEEEHSPSEYWTTLLTK